MLSQDALNHICEHTPDPRLAFIIGEPSNGFRIQAARSFAKNFGPGLFEHIFKPSTPSDFKKAAVRLIRYDPELSKSLSDFTQDKLHRDLFVAKEKIDIVTLMIANDYDLSSFDMTYVLISTGLPLEKRLKLLDIPISFSTRDIVHYADFDVIIKAFDKQPVALHQNDIIWPLYHSWGTRWSPRQLSALAQFCKISLKPR